MARHTADTILPGLEIISSNPLVRPIIHRGKQRIAKIDDITGEVDIYEANIKVKKVKRTTLAAFRSTSEWREKMPRYRDKNLLIIEEDDIYVSPIVYDISIEDKLLTILFEILEYIKQYMELSNTPIVNLHFYKMNLAKEDKVKEIVMQLLNWIEFDNCDIKADFIVKD